MKFMVNFILKFRHKYSTKREKKMNLVLLTHS